MKKNCLIIICILVIALIASLFLNYKQYRDALEQPEKIVVEVEKETKTEIKEEKSVAPDPVKSEVTEKISIKKDKKAKNSEKLSENGQKAEKNAEKVSESSANLSETISETDSTYEVPITQKVYEDSLYTAYVSGFHASLDSITVRNRIVTNTIRETVTKTVTKKKLFGFGVQAGYYLTPAGLQPGIGLGVHINILR